MQVVYVGRGNNSGLNDRKGFESNAIARARVIGAQYYTYKLRCRAERRVCRRSQVSALHEERYLCHRHQVAVREGHLEQRAFAAQTTPS